MRWVSEDRTSPCAASVSLNIRPLISPLQVTRPHGGVALAASRSRSNEPPRQIEDGAHKLLRAATSCACLELARARRRHLKPARPQRCQLRAKLALNARLATELTQLDQGAAGAVRPPYMLVSQQQ